jgi:predicted DNA-binding transcriptional regulator AlpA
MTISQTHYITLDKLSEKLGGRSRSSIYRDLENGQIPNPTRIGARLYWCEEEVDDFLRARRIGSS